MINKNIIKLKKILLAGSEEGWNIKELDIDTFKKYITTDFSESYKQYLEGNIMYRGDKKITNNISYIIPGNRYSEFTYNYYTELFSNILPSWNDFPKRNHCVVCSTNYHKSKFFGNMFIILPKNGTKIGVCSKEDIWASFPTLKNILLGEYFDLEIFTKTINYVMKTLYGKKVDLEFFLKDFKNHEKIDTPTYNFYKLLYNNKDNLVNFLNNIFDPYTNGFEISTINDKLPKNREVWFDNDCIAIKDIVIKNIGV